VTYAYSAVGTVRKRMDFAARTRKNTRDFVAGSRRNSRDFAVLSGRNKTSFAAGSVTKRMSLKCYIVYGLLFQIYIAGQVVMIDKKFQAHPSLDFMSFSDT
jgi:hypothetical protein